MKKLLLLGNMLVLAGCLMIMSGCNNSRSKDNLWTVFETADSGSMDVSLSVDVDEITTAHEEITVILKNDSDYELSFFLEDISLQKRIDEEWNTWRKDSNSNQPSAYIEHTCMPHGEVSLTIKSEQIIPTVLREKGDYRLYLPFAYVKDPDEWERAYTSFDLTMK